MKRFQSQEVKVHLKKGWKWLGNLMIVTSILLLIALAVGNVKSKARQNELLNVFESIKVEAGYDTSAFTIKDVEKKVGSRQSHGIEGVLTIPAIDLESAVLYGAEPNHLSQALGAIANMDKPGEMDGSYAIAGHQARVFGDYFNRLHELEVGSRFTFETIEKTMEFEVFDVKIVEPHEVEVLQPQKGIALFSLITCYPANSNKYRLVVQAKKVDMM